MLTIIRDNYFVHICELTDISSIFFVLCYLVCRRFRSDNFDYRNKDRAGYTIKKLEVAEL